MRPAYAYRLVGGEHRVCLYGEVLDHRFDSREDAEGWAAEMNAGTP